MNNESTNKKVSYFIPVFIFGALAGGIVVLAMAWLGPIDARDKVISEYEAKLFELNEK